MIKYQKNKIWLENISNLFCTSSLVPLDGMSLSEQMNALSRLVIIIFLVLLIIGFPFSGLFLLLSLLFIIILYYIQRNNMERFNAEYYTPHKNEIRGGSCDGVQRFYNDEVSLDNAFNNPKWISPNQRLAGEPNPKTKIPPVVIAPICDLSYWRGTNLVNYNQINEQGNIDLYRSGYQISPDFTENYKGQKREKPSGTTNRLKSQDQKDTKSFNIFPYIVQSTQLNDINTMEEYNPNKLTFSGSPSNLCSSNMKQYNENLFTQTIQPGIYTRNEINEPINSNIGISFNQQFQPTTHTTNRITGDINYIQHDSSIIEPIEDKRDFYQRATETDIYDPRFTGYGTSYRSYEDDLTGQTRFYYDDINAIRMPNYITRSHIDCQPFADQYGPIPEGFENGNPYTANIHELAENAFLQGALQHRTEISERLMRKVNSEQWQRRVAPIRKNYSRMMGGLGRG